MIDIHTHILPGMDDGAEDWEEALEMARAGAEDGLTHLVATPHSGWGNLIHKAEVEQQVACLQQRLEEAGIKLRVLAGVEVYIDPQLAALLKEERAFTINSSRYLLLELPMQQYPLYTEQVIFEVQLRGMMPILAHPERNLAMQEDLGLLEKLVRRGVLVQVTGGSLLDAFGRLVQRTAEAMLTHRLAHIIASDAHSQYLRPPVLSRAVTYASKLIGPREAEAMATTVPQSILENKELSVPEPLEYRPRRSWVLRR